MKYPHKLIAEQEFEATLKEFNDARAAFTAERIGDAELLAAKTRFLQRGGFRAAAVIAAHIQAGGTI